MNEENKNELNDKPDEEKKNRDEHDPYNFFRLSTDPEDDDKRGGGNKPPKRFPFLGMLLLVVGALVFVNMFLASKPDDAIDFLRSAI